MNALRSELSAAVEAPSELVRDYGARQMLQRAAREPREAGPLEDPPSQTELEEEVTVSCFLRLDGSVTEPAGLPPRVVRQGGLRYAFGDVTSVAADVAGET